MHTFFTYKNLDNDINFVNRFIELNNIELQLEFIENHLFKKEKYLNEIIENSKIKKFKYDAGVLIEKLTSNSKELNIELMRSYFNPNIRKDIYIFDKILTIEDYKKVEQYNDAFSCNSVINNSFINQLLLNIKDKDRRKILIEVSKNEEISKNKHLLLAIITSDNYMDMLLLIHTAFKYPNIFDNDKFLNEFVRCKNIEDRLELIKKGLRGRIR